MLDISWAVHRTHDFRATHSSHEVRDISFVSLKLCQHCSTYVGWCHGSGHCCIVHNTALNRSVHLLDRSGAGTISRHRFRLLRRSNHSLEDYPCADSAGFNGSLRSRGQTRPQDGRTCISYRFRATRETPSSAYSVLHDSEQVGQHTSFFLPRTSADSPSDNAPAWDTCTFIFVSSTTRKERHNLHCICRHQCACILAHLLLLFWRLEFHLQHRPQ
jgi:hypothetical protein